MRHLLVIAAITLSMVMPAWAGFTYQLDNGTPAGGGWNNSSGTEVEDNWVANSFTAVADGTSITAVKWLAAADMTGSTAQVMIYAGSSLTSSARLTLLAASNEVILGSPVDGLYSIPVAANVAEGDIFFGAVLIRNVTAYPWYVDSADFLGRSFFDVGPTMSGAYDINNTSTAVPFGTAHPTIGPGSNSPNNVMVRVEAVPEPLTMSLVLSGLAGLVLRRKTM